MPTEFENRVYSLTSKIPKGKISTYKEIAKALNIKAYRAVGQALRKNPYWPRVACHRVVSSNGEIGGFKGKKSGRIIEEKISLLKKEGIEIENNKINLKKYFFKLNK
ncbi:MGMT family protein [Candidatus Woesearchaeota archaeon]|nr:MGMT family protein [Candidatus Woesearchaeota archaeon]